MTLLKQPVTRRSIWLLLLATLFALVAVLSPVRAEVPVPPLTNYVVDVTGTLTPVQLDELNQSIAQLEQEKGSQIMVLMVPTVQPDDTVETYARRVFDEWRIGRAKIDDGVLVLVAKDDRRMRIETGYGLEGAITDVQASYIIDRDMAPAFRAGNYYAGIRKAVDQLTLLIQGEELPAVKAAEDSPFLGSKDLPIELLIFFAVFVLFWPIWLAPIVGGAFILAITGSVGLALVAAVFAIVWNLIAKSFLGSGIVEEASRQSAKGSPKRRRGRDNWPGGFGGFGGGGFGGGGFGGGFGGGGGGSSGGGGASGGW